MPIQPARCVSTCLSLCGVVVSAVAALSCTAPVAARLLFVGTYTGPTSKGIYAFRFDEQSGTLTAAGLAAETASPSFLATSADGRFLYAVNELASFGGEPSGSVSAFAVDAAAGRLTLLNTQSSRGAHPCHLALDRTGRFLAVANYTGGTFSILPVGEDGRLGAATDVLTNNGSGPNRERQDAPHAHDVVFDATNRFLLGADLGIDRVLVYRFDAATGRVTRNDPPSAVVAPGSGPRHLAFTPKDEAVYVTNELASTVTAFAWDVRTGTLTPQGGVVSTLPADFHGDNATAEIAVHPNGKFVYGSNRGHDSIAVFSRDATGALHLVQHAPTRGKTPRNFSISPSGRWLIAANQDSGTLAVFSLDQRSGQLSPVGPLAEVGSPVSVLFMP